MVRFVNSNSDLLCFAVVCKSWFHSFELFKQLCLQKLVAFFPNHERLQKSMRLQCKLIPHQFAKVSEQYLQPCTLPYFLKQCTTSNTFFLDNASLLVQCYGMFISHEQFLQVILDRFWFVPTLMELVHMSQEDVKAKLRKNRLTCTQVFKWIKYNDMVLDTIKDALTVAIDEIQTVEVSVAASWRKYIQNNEQYFIETEEQHPQSSIVPQDPALLSDHKMFAWKPEHVACQMTLLHWDMFSKLKLHHFFNGGWRKDCPHQAAEITVILKNMEHLKHFFMQRIMNASDQQVALCYVLQVTEQLYKLNNAHGLHCIIQALQELQVKQLACWSQLPMSHISKFELHVSMFSNMRYHNHFVYQKTPSSLGSFAMLSQELQLVYEKFGDTFMDCNQVIQWQACQSFERVLSNSFSTLKMPYNLQIVPELQAVLL